MSMRKSLLTALLCGSASLLFSAPAQAAMQFCNRTTAPVDAAYAYPHDQLWISQGWWSLAPGECKIVDANKLKYPYYYYYGVSAKLGMEWRGPYPFCGRTESFEITGDKDCQKRGFDVIYFDEVDVGQNPSDYVVEFRTPDNPAPAGAPPPAITPPSVMPSSAVPPAPPPVLQAPVPQRYGPASAP